MVAASLFLTHSLPLAIELPIDNSLLITTLVIGALVLLFGGGIRMAADAVGVWDKLRRKPPAEEVFATKAELAEMEKRSGTRASDNTGRIEAAERRMADKLSTLETRFDHEITDMERRVTAELASNRENNQLRFGTIDGKLDSMQSTMQTLSNDLMRAVGRLEGVVPRMVSSQQN